MSRVEGTELFDLKREKHGTSESCPPVCREELRGQSIAQLNRQAQGQHNSVVDPPHLLRLKYVCHLHLTIENGDPYSNWGKGFACLSFFVLQEASSHLNPFQNQILVTSITHKSIDEHIQG